MLEAIDNNWARAFSEQSKNSARNTTFAMKARKEGYNQLANLFKAIANAESVHANKFLMLIRGKIGKTNENLSAALQEKIRIDKELYSKMIEESNNASHGVQEALEQTIRTNSEHIELLKNAMENMLSNKKIQYHVCQICGHINENIVPENCPVCNAVSGKFKKI